ncbi:hybrid sensor histidine kinase/response regulator [Chondromyces crocatus]|uniref:histidine kinase n=1 Tax=Chondromyces crocatus TaxID=52 RepID=A0A0K1ED60_CHOCO|nr:ATP-binding protein [Chondromyces crocatus]AKT38784.1 uncharacterized protein CMC5_029300 [Chondromyces crocatus]
MSSMRRLRLSLALLVVGAVTLIFLGSVAYLATVERGSVLTDLVFAGLLIALALIGVVLWLKARDQAWALREANEALRREVVERAHAESVLRANEARLRTLVRHFPGGAVFLFDHDLRFLVADGQAIEVVSRAEQQLEGRTLREALTPEKYEEVAPIFLAALKEEPQEAIPVEYAGRFFMSQPIAVRGESGAVVAGLVIALDVTDVRQAEEERRRMEVKITEAQRLESLGVFAGGIAHDFNNMLAAVLGHAEVLSLDLRARPAARESVDAVISVTKRASELVKHMLAYAGKGRVVPRPVSLDEVIGGLDEMLGAVVGKHARVIYRLGEGLPAVIADPAQLRQILLNLLGNASDAISQEAGGTITLSTSVERLSRSELDELAPGADREPGSYVRVTVTDTGAGMAPELIGRIFDPFFSTKSKVSGRGLGLAAVQGLVRSHRGVLTVASTPGEGTTFRVWLPASAETPEPLGPARTVELPARRGTVLVIDDEEVMRVTLEQTLGRLGYVVRVAEDGTEGMVMMRAGIPNLTLVLVDLTMPEVSGDKVVRASRKLRPDVPVILMSGYLEEDVIERYGDLGQAGFLHKPFSVEELRAAIHDALVGQEPPTGHGPLTGGRVTLTGAEAR